MDLFKFEKDFDPSAFHSWTLQYWDLTFVYSIIYLVAIFSVQHYMRNRSRFELRSSLIFWSGFLALFSIAGAVRTLPELIHVLRYEGWYQSMCNPSYFTLRPTSFWAFMFVISKVYELGDTIFVVLTKKPLIFLHWYHHVTVMIYVWYSYTDHTAPGRWFMVMNYIVHSFMYTYYTLKAMKISTPRCISVGITFLQIIQMVMGVIVNYSVYLAKLKGLSCNQTNFNLACCSAMYASYLILFSSFFYHSYLKTKPTNYTLTKLSQKSE
ncbi:hypothetical protein HELRODRAFT_78878 [Helobdella robusta]|uniref:Elongation of very long chain fatty acids protein n=1 Tax=Helobdella robusta TaxID=6412 RepID=T1G3G6_HELRO|nr:hypothetical protein HELRODRAFT_78878 [Helobdella robusta]ESO04683.1 hypothetical protein HELRODRAFT_78878 [Helobdella robusta]